MALPPAAAKGYCGERGVKGGEKEKENCDDESNMIVGTSDEVGCEYAIVINVVVSVFWKSEHCAHRSELLNRESVAGGSRSVRCEPSLRD